ncbi:MAG TPA: GNAT family N-acetyltransferase [Candidatus Limnocylindria bacterium]|nr:GNAT family N-acetyltransferase [Candidatus Limnocylindria bacterium]
MTVQAPPVAGLSLRPYRPDDATAVADLLNRAAEADGAPWRASPAELANWLSRSNEHFDAARDASVAEADGTLVGYRDVEWIDTNDGQREFRLGGTVHPDWRRRGIGTWLLRDSEEHARRRVGELPPSDRPHLFGAWQADTAVGAVALMRREGYQPVRYFFDMVRRTMDDIVVPPLPDGLEIRPVSDDQLRQLWEADVEAFRDHWGGFDASDERYREWRNDPKFDPSLFVVAWDGDEIAGGVINEINETENRAFDRKRGWLASVFVRRPWRRRGLARAVVARSLVVLRDRGMTSAGLGVDADNPTGALRLYEHAGFEVEHRSTAYRKPME